MDRLVYELYGLTDAEIQIVEGAKPRLFALANGAAKNGAACGLASANAKP